MRNLVFITVLLGSCVVLSCRKNKEDDVIISRFNYNDTEYVTDYVLFTVQNANQTNPYTLSFYSSDVSYDFSDSSFVGVGELLVLNLSSSIFTDSGSNDYNITDLKANENLIVNSGYLVFNNDQLQETIEIKQGSITLSNYNNKYYFNYQLDLKNGLTLSGLYSGGLLVVDYISLKNTLIIL